MSRSFEAQGIIHSIDQTREYGQNGFTKREFVIKLTGDGEKEEYPNYVAMEFLKDKCALLDTYNIGDEVKVTFNLSGRLWNPPGSQKSASPAYKHGALKVPAAVMMVSHSPCQTMMNLALAAAVARSTTTYPSNKHQSAHQIMCALEH